MLTESVNPAEQLRTDWFSLPKRERVRRFRALPTNRAAELFPKLDARSQARLLLALDKSELQVWMHLLPPDEAADVILAAPPDKRNDLLSGLDEPGRGEVQVLLTYRSDVAGGLMNPRFARLRPEFTVDQAIAYLRQQAPSVESLYCAYALDDEQHLLGAVFLRPLLRRSDPKGQRHNAP